MVNQQTILSYLVSLRSQEISGLAPSLAVSCSPGVSVTARGSDSELASKNMLSGSIKMVYALIYTLFLGFGLQIGSYLTPNNIAAPRELAITVSHSSTIFSGP